MLIIARTTAGVQQWRSFHETGTMGNANEPSGNWCLDPRTGSPLPLWGLGGITPEQILKWYMANPAISCVLAEKWFAMPSIMNVL